MLIEIKGVQFVNKGAELMLFAILEKIKAYWPEAEICLVADGNTPDEKRRSINAYRKINFIKNRFDFNGLSYLVPSFVRRQLKQKFGVVTEADVDLLLDASGFAYSEQWKYLPLKQASSVAKRFKQKNKPFILMPQALGPFSSEDKSLAAKALFENAQFTFARDETSLSCVKQLTQAGNVKLAPDFTNLYQPHVPAKYAYLKGQVAFIVNSKMVSAQNPNKQWRENYLSTVQQLIEASQANNCEVFFLNHEGKDDLALCAEINAQLKQPLEVVSPESSGDIKAIIGQCSWVFSSRFHGCVSALSQNVPCLSTSWSHKYEMLFKDYTHPDWLIAENETKQQLTQRVENFLANVEHNAKSLQEPAAKIKLQAEQVWQFVSDQVKNK